MCFFIRSFFPQDGKLLKRRVENPRFD